MLHTGCCVLAIVISLPANENVMFGMTLTAAESCVCVCVGGDGGDGNTTVPPHGVT